MSRKKEDHPPQFSEHISAACRMMERAQKDYEWCSEQVSRMEKLTQDYLHKIELEDLDYGERAKIATQLRRCRRLRREYKDTTEILEPIVSFLDSERGRQTLNLLKEVLGKTRKAEERMETRVYHHRVLDEPAIVDGRKDEGE